MKRYIVNFAVLLCVSASLVISASAYVKLGFTVGSKVTYYPYEGFASLSRTHMSNAATVWNDAAGSTLLAVSTTTQPNRSGYYKDDGKNYIYAEDVGAGSVAQNHYWYSYSKLTQSDINFNMYYSWANSAVNNAYDVYSVCLHEFGHTMGLGDVKTDGYKSRSIMYYTVYTNSTRRTLLSEDLAGIRALY